MKFTKSGFCQKIISSCVPIVKRRCDLGWNWFVEIDTLLSVPNLYLHFDTVPEEWRWKEAGMVCVFFAPKIFWIHYKGDDSYFVSLKALVICTTSELCCKAAAVLEFVVDEQGAYV